VSRNSFVEWNYLNIARGLVPGASIVHRMGYNTDCDQGSETIWTGGGLYPWSAFTAGASQLSVISSTTDDTGEVIAIEGLDANYNPLRELVTLTDDGNDPTAVTTQGSFIRVFRMYETSNGGAAGIITAKVGATTVGHMLAGKGQSLMGIYTIPAGKTGYILCGDASISKGGDGVVEMKVRYFEGGGFLSAHVAELYDSSYRYDFPVPQRLPEKTDIDIRFTTANNNFKVTCAFDLILVDGA
jgi:hypothetical protein